MPGTTTQTLRPTTNVTDFGFTAVNTGGAPNAHTAVADNSDTTYLAEASGPAAGSFGFSFGSSSVGPSDAIQNIVIRTREARAGGTPPPSHITVYDIGSGASTTIPWNVTTSTSPADVTLATLTSIGGLALTQSMLNQIVVYGFVPVHGRLYELYVDVNYNEVPVISAVTPTGTVALADPIIGWTYADAEGDPQERVDIAIFPSAVMAAEGFPSQPVEFGRATIVVRDIHTVATSFQIPDLVLPIGGYRVFVRAGDQGAGGRKGLWAFADFTVSVAAPTAPMISTGTYDALRGRLPLSVRSFDNLLSDHQAGAENATSDYTVVNATASLDTTATRLWSPPDGPVISAKSLKLVASSSADVTAMTPSTNATGVPVDVGQVLLAGAHVFSTNCRTATASIRWINSGNGVISTTTGAAIPTANGSAPAPIWVVGTAPAGAVRATVIITIVAAVNADAHWIDDFFINPTVADTNKPCGTWCGNLVSNTSFETYAGSSGAADWGLVTAGAGQTVAAIAEVGADGARVLQIQKAESSLAPPYGEWPNLAGSVPRLPCTAGQVYVVSGYQQVLAGTGVTVEAVYQDATHDQFTCTAGATNNEEAFLAAFQIPTGKTSVSFRFLPVAVGANGSIGEVHIDLVNIVLATTAVAAAFTALGGASGTPKGAGLGTSLAAFALGTPPTAFFPWVRGGFSSTETISAERSDDGGATWTAVRGQAVLDSALIGSLWDYEAPPNSQPLYRATASALDPQNSSPTSSPTSGPALPDPGFDLQLWGSPDPLDPFAVFFQPPFGTAVGVLTSANPAATGGTLSSPLGQLPSWAATIRVRFLARSINATGAVVKVAWTDQLGEAAFAMTTIATLVGSAGDSGWAWYDSGQVTVPGRASGFQVQIAGQTAPNPAAALLVAFDFMAVSATDAGGRSTAGSIPQCVQWLKDPLNPGANMEVECEIAGLTGSGNSSASGTESSSAESQVVLSPAGRPDAVVLSDAVVSDEVFGGFQFILRNDQEWLAFQGLRKAQRTLLLQLPYGDLIGEQHYVRFGASRVVGRVQSQDQSQRQKRRVTVDLIEVAAP